MADKIPLRFHYSGTDTIGLSEYQATDKINFSYINATSGTDFKTINNQSILGSGNITIEGGTGGAGETFNPFLLAGM